MQETAHPWAFLDALGSGHGVPASDGPDTSGDDLQERLARATSALTEAESRHQSEMAAAAAQLADQKAACELALARNAAIWAMVDEQLREAALGVERARQSQAAAVADAARASQRATELEAQAAEDRDRRRAMEQSLEQAARERDEAETRHASALTAAAVKAGDLESELQRAHEESESRAAEIQRLAGQEADLASRLAQAVSGHAELERRLHATEAAIHEADALATRERLAACQRAAEREAELDGQLQLERNVRADLERAAEAAEKAARDERELYEQALAASTTHVEELEARLSREVRELTSARDAAIDDARRREAALAEALEDASQVPRLRQRIELAHRMEAVGRLASEAAATCGSLIADVHQNVQWLVMSNSDHVIRQRGESVLDDVTRVAGLLRQLSGYVEENGREPAADLCALVRDLEPVLRRVAGQDVALRLPESGAPVRLDLSSERVERLLVNLASYGRERMPEGGRLAIDLATVVVDHESAARHTGLRAGSHALITMTRSRAATEQAPDDSGPRSRRSNRTPGVELGALQSHVGECGGHLWINIDPQGDMVSKLHLPLPDGGGDA
jgi:hypothetical protein